jgi:hypothetical protein
MWESDERRVELSDGQATTVHVAVAERAASRVRLVRMSPGVPLERWCARRAITDAVSGGYATKPHYEPLGELRIDGHALSHRPFERPWRDTRAAVALNDGQLRIAPRDELPSTPDGWLLQAGPLLVRDGASAVAGVEDPEGFSSTRHEFDEDITAAREPRLALALRGEDLLAIAADGRAPGDAGLTLAELADVVVELGADCALNLDGGSAGVVIAGGRRLNVPRSDEGEALAVSSPSVSALVLQPSRNREACNRPRRHTMGHGHENGPPVACAARS